MKQAIIENLSENYPWKDRISWFSEIDSTNTYLKKQAQAGAAEGSAAIADCQIAGRGRLGRSFHSPSGQGIYLSMLLRPECRAEELMHLTCSVAVAMCDAIEKVAGFRPGIKWTNDLVYEKRKLGGILTELGFRGDGMVDYVVVGIGINCNQKESDFPEEIRQMAGSVAGFAKESFRREALIAAMLECLQEMRQNLFQREEMLAKYRKDCVTLGQEVSILRGDDVSYGFALDVDSQGGLVIRDAEGKLRTVSAGEVSVRGMYHYI